MLTSFTSRLNFSIATNINHHIPMKTYSHKSVVYEKTSGKPVDCLFCRIQQKKEPGTIIYEDGDFVVFKTIAPATSTHLLVTPREHVQNVASLSGPRDAALVKKLVDIGKIAVGDALASDTLFCFHIPPWFVHALKMTHITPITCVCRNSIDHLHLHAIARPSMMTFFGRQKYSVGSSWCKTAAVVIDELERSIEHPRERIFINDERSE